MSFSIRHSTDVDDIIDISWRQARSKTEVLIFEIGKMDDLMPFEQAEQIRKSLMKNKIRVRQISNYKLLNKFTDVEGYENSSLRKHIGEDIFKVDNEVVIFEDTVAIYRVKPEVTYLEVNDINYANMMRSLFDSIWKVSDTMILVSGSGDVARQYKPITVSCSLKNGSIPVVIYPANGDGGIEEAFDNCSKGSIEKYVQHCISMNEDEINNADMIIAYAWGYEGKKMCDFWLVSRNRLSDTSGFLYDAITFKEGEVVKNMGVGSGDSNIVLTAEELLLRELILEKGLSFNEAAYRSKYFPKFPAGMKPTESFYKNAVDNNKT